MEHLLPSLYSTFIPEKKSEKQNKMFIFALGMLFKLMVNLKLIVAGGIRYKLYTQVLIGYFWFHRMNVWVF